MKYHWSHSELELLYEYDRLGIEMACCHFDKITKEDILRFLLLEAKLLILNKYVIGYLGYLPKGIYSVNEALRLEEYYAKEGKVFIFLPLVKEPLTG